MEEVPSLYVCLGSACHQLQGYRLLPLLEELIRKHGLAGRLQLKGAFCLETCQQGRSLKFRDRIFTGLTEATIGHVFEQEILPHLKRS